MGTQETILVPLDGSELSEVVVPYAEAVAAVTPMRLRLLAVVKPEPRALTSRSERLAEQLELRQQTKLEEQLHQVAVSLRERGVLVETQVVRGDPVDAILAAAAQPEVAAVALATHGRGGLDRSFMGSVTDKVMRLSPRSTLLVRPPYMPPPHHPVTLERLLVPLDGSDRAEAALPLANRLATADTRLFLVRVEPWRTEGAAPYGTVPEFVQLEEDVAEAAEQYLALLTRGLATRGSIACRVLRGRPGPSLVDFALHEHVDLVVMTTHGAGGLRRLVLGSTADFVVRSGVPTLLLPPAATPHASART